MLARCVCLILVLFMAGSPRQRIEPSRSNSWWGSEASSKFTKVAYQSWKARDFATAAEVYQKGYEEAERHHDVSAQERYLSSIAGCRLMQLQYRDALEIYLRARKLAASIGDRQELGAIAFNLSSLYMQVWDFDAALVAANEGRAIVSTLKKPYYKA